MIFVNFKTYKEATADKAVKLAKICQQVSFETGIKVVPIVQTADLERIKQKIHIPLFVQHLDYQAQGAFTGFISTEAVGSAGASGTLLNHSEHRLSFAIIEKTLKRIKKVEETFQSMVCASDLKEVVKLVEFKPDLLAYEPPELIGSQEKSVASVYPDIIAKTVKKAVSTPLIVGAGIHSANDVEISLKQGAKGILVSSSVVFSKNPKDKLLELAQAFG